MKRMSSNLIISLSSSIPIRLFSSIPISLVHIQLIYNAFIFTIQYNSD